MPLRDVLRRHLKKEKTKRSPASWLIRAVPVPVELPQDPPQSPQACLHTVHPHGRGCGQVGIGRDPPTPPAPRVRHPSPGQVLCHSPQGLLLLGPVLGSGLVGHLQPQPFPAAGLQDLQGSKCVAGLPSSQPAPCCWGTCLFPMVPCDPHWAQLTTHCCLPKAPESCRPARLNCPPAKGPGLPPVVTVPCKPAVQT